MVWFEGTAATPGRLLNEVVRLIASRLDGRRVELRIGDTPVHLTVERVEIGDVDDDLETAADALFDVATHLGDSARRHATDPVRFGFDAFDTIAAAIDRAFTTAPARAMRGEFDVAASAAARFVDLDADAPGTHTAALDVRCGPVTGRLGDGFVIVASDVSLTARVRATALAGWLERLGVDLGPAADVEPGDDGRLRFALGARGFGLLRRLVRLVVVPAVESGRLVLDVDAVELVGWRVPLPARARRRVAVDTSPIRADLEVRAVRIAADEVAVDGWLPRIVQPVSLRQVDELRRRLVGPATGRLEVQLTRPDPTPGSPGRPTGGPASGTR